MKILDVKIDWMVGYANFPEIKVLVDKIPHRSDLIYEVKTHGYNSIFFAHEDGLVDFIIRSSDLSKDEEGLAGRKFVLNVKDGSRIKEVSFNGGWIGRSGRINKIFSPHSTEVSMTDKNKTFYEDEGFFHAGYISVKVVREALKKIKNPLKTVEYPFKNVKKPPSNPVIPCDLFLVVDKGSEEKGYQIFRSDMKNACEICKGFIFLPSRHPFDEKKRECNNCLGKGLILSDHDKKLVRLNKIFRHLEQYDCFSLRLGKTLRIKRRGNQYYVQGRCRWARVDPVKLELRTKDITYH